jgi:hypothetical protein
MKSPPSLQRKADPAVGTGQSKAFSAEAITKPSKVETTGCKNLRTNFSRKLWTTPAQDSDDVKRIKEQIKKKQTAGSQMRQWDKAAAMTKAKAKR